MPFRDHALQVIYLGTEYLDPRLTQETCGCDEIVIVLYHNVESKGYSK